MVSCRLYHQFIKADLRISIKEFNRISATTHQKIFTGEAQPPEASTRSHARRARMALQTVFTAAASESKQARKSLVATGGN
jgi:hypothetical protein